MTSRDAPQKAEDLSRHDWISFSGLMASDKWRFGEGVSERWVPVHARMIVNNANAASEAAATGLRVARVLSYQVADAVAEGPLRLS